MRPFRVLPVNCRQMDEFYRAMAEGGDNRSFRFSIPHLQADVAAKQAYSGTEVDPFDVLNEGDGVSAAATTATKPNLFCCVDREPVTAAALRTCPDQFMAGALQAETAASGEFALDAC